MTVALNVTTRGDKLDDGDMREIRYADMLESELNERIERTSRERQISVQGYLKAQSEGNENEQRRMLLVICLTEYELFALVARQHTLGIQNRRPLNLFALVVAVEVGLETAKEKLNSLELDPEDPQERSRAFYEKVLKAFEEIKRDSLPSALKRVKDEIVTAMRTRPDLTLPVLGIRALGGEVGRFISTMARDGRVVDPNSPSLAQLTFLIRVVELGLERRDQVHESGVLDDSNKHISDDDIKEICEYAWKALRRQSAIESGFAIMMDD